MRHQYEESADTLEQPCDAAYHDDETVEYDHAHLGNNAEPGGAAHELSRFPIAHP